MRVALLVVALLARSAAAQDCDPHEAAELRAHLTHAAHNAKLWNSVWAWTFTASTVGSLAFAISDLEPEYTNGAYVSAGKSAIAALARWVTPLSIDVPAPAADTCADVAALRAQVAAAGKKERGMFYLGHAGGIVLNAAGFFLIWKYADIHQAILSVAIGYPVGLLSNYTMPRGTWHLWRDRDWGVTLVPPTGNEHAWLLTAGAAF